jgi:AmmeMemoRadiSam system protein A
MPLLSHDDRRALLALARQVIVETVVRERVPDLPSFSGELSEPGSAFVTVRREGILRGCLGRTDRTLPLGEAVAQSAISAVLRDPRFPPVAAAEVADLEIEISVLSEFSMVPPDAVDPHRHGVCVVRGQQRGLLLPQVAAERHWSAERLLAEACGKAGLAPDAWRDSGSKIFAFTAEVFSDADL